MKYRKLQILNCVALGLIAFTVNAAPSDVTVSGKQYGVILGGSRVIYPLDSNGVVVSVDNPQDYPVLIQTRVFDENKSEAAPFVVTPPLFRLDAKQRSSLRLTQTGGSFSRDKESLQWLCVKGIPPKEDDLWVGDKGKEKSPGSGVGISLQIAIDNCIKIMVRPNELKGNPSQFAGDLVWKIDGQKLVAENLTPFYMNLGKVTFSGKEVLPHFVPPKSKWMFDLPKGTSGQGHVSWQIINDQGGLSQTYSKNVIF
ncbi:MULTISPECIES: fimbria/pilus periplasmic chaperone [Enterobacteriaceae]|uniref:fimbria/pilus periplasmic chaperone n=1 Tax=Enterobacteriaceae TaxID=543 RepID=UPI0007D89FCD|nr:MULTISPECIES: fimbria/pilus periplasmic chaperone [Enterobacteriaceae]EJD5910125.1 fimbria/pilus periplasmic chaperone [Escherichia coli]ELO5097928.1 fimbria/pilus periplasmic chaperone [Escherichia coli]ELP3956254.1 fimbria/pilus periplasmic chaperone [Escherichia coli]ELT9843363.1 fimbria/pilus periplasmic chaperone [Escherichia coli]KAB3506703.1 fimbria/pilus periplasmic chaperone [Escherichia coli]